MKNLIILGKNSTIYQDIKKKLKFKPNYEFSHADYIKLNKINNKNYTFLIYFGFDNKLSKSIDSKVIEISQKKNFHLIYFSTRKIYKKMSNYRYSEMSKILTNDKYSKVKFKNEELIRSNLKRYTIFRLGTYLPDSFKNLEYKKSFFNILVRNLLNKKISFDFSTETEKDFLLSSRLVKILNKTLNNNFLGTYNLSSGYGVKINYIISKLTSDKSIKVIVKNKKIYDSFILKNNLINRKLKIKHMKNDFKIEFNDYLKKIVKFYQLN